MTFTIRAAERYEYPIIREILAKAFRTEDEARLWDYLVANDPALTPEGVRVAALDGRPVACTVVVPRQVRTSRGWTPGAIITLVACLPELQGQGYGGATVRNAVAYMEQQGLVIGVLYGHPGYYPRFGFVPVLPHTETRVAVSACPASGESLQPATDYVRLTQLYSEGPGLSPCAVARTPDAWIWTPRNEGAVLALPDHAGYAYVYARDGALRVREAVGDAERLLGALAAEGRRMGLEDLCFFLPPGAPLSQLAAALPGATQKISPPGAGMAVVTGGQNLTELLGEAYPKWSLAPFWD